MLKYLNELLEEIKNNPEIYISNNRKEKIFALETAIEILEKIKGGKYE